ncbi:MAG: hypothetical protein K0U67_05460 [Actinomycetia bacterium]|nr:hypothetical protein [Actinomycetes bacterium]
MYGLPILLAVIAIALIYRHMGARRHIYRLPEPWTYGPVLWAATDELIPPGSRGHHGPADRVSSVGGGASGHW